MDLTHLSPLFSKELHLSPDFFFTETSFSEQCRLPLGLSQMAELCEMEKAGRFDFETALLKDSNSDEILGFVMIERTTDAGPGVSDGGDCLIFSPAVCVSERKREFLDLFNELFSNKQPMTVISVSQKEMKDDILEYYSKNALALFGENSKILAYDSVYSGRRVEKARKAFLRMKEEANVKLDCNAAVLEICCGNGMSTLALHAENISPFCLDINTEDICTGLAHGVLVPSKTMIMDATRLSEAFEQDSLDLVIGFMIGTIYEFNKQMWFSMAGEAAAVLKQNGFLFLTLRTEPEAGMVFDYLKSIGIDGKIIDNRDDETGYDQWIYVGQKQ
ncbi:class I SAM-dependent methyltransferase [Methanolapillus millepedarum]|uniref:Uncharacterized protein n=1 Tax=Methanolapillus millepedarum TaxID=3028296 RepID=A0AA96ZV27_9EURY|nr:hypothetical protein MsAc7_04980 [Methanosarcinaceae archaeon Ac7]